MATSYRQLVENNSYLSKGVETFNENRIAYIFLLPLVLFLILLIWVPFIQGIIISFYRWPFQADPTFVGLDNYRFLLTWEPFYDGLIATVIFGFATLFQLAIAIIASLTLKRIKFKSLLSASFLIPYTMPPVATGTLWLFLAGPSNGPIFRWLTEVGLLESPIYWTISGNASLAVITLVSAWSFWPFMFLILFATVISIPNEYYETAEVYGANRWQMFRHVTLPQLKTAIFVVVTIRVVWNLSKISQPLQITRGGPAYDTSILPLLLYRFAFFEGNLGRAFAVGIIFLLMVLGFIILFFRAYEKSEGMSL